MPWAHLPDLVVPAVAVAVLAALESLLSASVADAMSVSERHDPDRELFGQGLANLASPLFGGLPATAAIARTAVNVRSGATSRMASVVHAGFLLLVVLLLAPVVGHIPLAALAGVLIATAVRMVEVGSVRTLVRAGRGDAVVLVGTAVATVAFDLVTAVVLGVVAAGAVALRRMARSAVLEQVAVAGERATTTTPTRSTRCSTSTSWPTGSTARSSSRPPTGRSSSCAPSATSGS